MAYEHFNDPEWDGEPLPPEPPGEPRPPGNPGDPGGVREPKAEVVVVKLSPGNERRIRYMGATTYWWHDRMISAQAFMQQLFGDLGQLVVSEDELRAIWSDPGRREGFLRRLADLGYDAERLNDMRRLIDAPNSDIFDVLAYVRFELAPLARSERVRAARATGLEGCEREMRGFLGFVLGAYERNGIGELAQSKVGDFLRIRYGGIHDAKRMLGSVEHIRSAFAGIQAHLFRPQ